VVKTFGVCDFSRFGGYRLALAALALVVFGAYDSYPSFYKLKIIFFVFSYYLFKEKTISSPFRIFWQL